MTDYLVPMVILFAALASLRKQENCYDHLLQGCQEGLQVLLSIVPSLILLLTAVYMLRASGAVDMLSRFLQPVFCFLGIPPETAMLVLIRPISGSAALAVGAEDAFDAARENKARVLLMAGDVAKNTVSAMHNAAAQKEAGLSRKIVGIELQDKAIPRAGYPVEIEGQQVGVVTTGYRSISTDRSVCVAMVDKAYTELGTQVEIRIRKKVFPGIVCKKRFYETNYKK